MADKEKLEQANMDIWNAVCTTDPKYTKGVAYGARKFTCIDAQSQIMAATKLWGPYGGKWGMEDLKWSYSTLPDGAITELILDAVMFYPGGKFEISSDIGYAPGKECRKKLLTDLTTKALSKLGFNADVFLGEFDGNRYDKKPQNDKKPPVRQAPRQAQTNVKAPPKPLPPWIILCQKDKNLGDMFKALKLKIKDGNTIWKNVQSAPPEERSALFTISVKELYDFRLTKSTDSSTSKNVD